MQDRARGIRLRTFRFRRVSGDTSKSILHRMFRRSTRVCGQVASHFDISLENGDSAYCFDEGERISVAICH